MKAQNIILQGLLASLLVGCQSTGPHFDAHRQSQLKLAKLANVNAVAPGKLNPDWLQPGMEPFTLGPGDRIEIETVGDETTRDTLVVGPDGKIYYQLLPGLDVSGLTLGETKSLLERELLKYIRGQPQIALSLRGVESKRVWLTGRLNAPGVYPLAAPMTLLEALSLAGGPLTTNPSAARESITLVGGRLATTPASPSEDLTDLQRSFVVRKGKLLPVNFDALLRRGDLSQNIYLQPGDFIHVASAATGNIYVLGAVVRPQIVSFSSGMTLLSAIANAGGSIRYADLDHVAIVRGSLTSPKVAIVDFKSIMKGKDSDVLVEPRDIIYIPTTPYKTVARYVDIILDTFARTIGANEGARVGSPNAVPVGASVPINNQ